MAEKNVQCPHCNELFSIPDETDDKVTRSDIEQILSRLPQSGGDEHRHKTFDEFFDCPQCHSWVEKTGQRYQVSLKEAPQEREPEPPGKPALGSIFTTKREGS